MLYFPFGRRGLPRLLLVLALFGVGAGCGTAKNGWVTNPGQAPDGGVSTMPMNNGVVVNPPTATVVPGGTQTFTCSVPGAADMTCAWSVQEGDAGGTITAAGAYTAPAAPGTYHVVAKSNADMTKWGTGVVLVPRKVTDCSALGAAGTWQDITPPQVSLDPNHPIPNGFNQFGVGAFVVDPQDSTTIYLGTCEQGIYKSTDCGATWTHVNTGRNGSDLDSGMNWTMAIDPVNDQVLFANAGYSTNTLYKSTNGGVDWDKAFNADALKYFMTGGFVETVAIDPANHNHVLVTMHENCVNGAAPGCVMESMDSGASWRAVNGTWGAWGENSGLDILDSNTWLYTVPFSQPSGIWRTADSGNTWTQVYDKFPIPGVGRGAGGALYMPDQQGSVLRSMDNGVTWSDLANSPNQTDAVVVVGGTVYATFSDATNRTAHQPYFSAPESNPTQWGMVMSPPMDQGAGRNGFYYDTVHHVLYSSNTLSGFWRVVLQ